MRLCRLVAFFAALAFSAAAPATGADAVVIIVNKSNKIDNLSAKALRQIFAGQQTRWPDGQPIQTLASNPDTPEHAAAIHFLFGMTEAEYKKYILQATFTGNTAQVPRESGPSQAIVNLVGLIPGSISFARQSLIGPNVKVLRIDGTAPGDAAYPLVAK